MELAQTWSSGLNGLYVVFAFVSAFFLGLLKGVLVGPVSAVILILGNVGIILGLFPAHVAWTIYTLIKIDRFDIPLKVAILFGLPALLGIWLGLSIAGSVLVGIGYGFFTPWVSTFEAFRHGNNELNKFKHCVLDGTWETVAGSCTVVRDFADLCFHSYPDYLKELRESPASEEVRTLRLIHIPACMLVGVLGLIVEIPLYTAIVVVKSPYMLFKGWYRLIHDMISREGPFLEVACIPIAGLTILVWPIVVVGSIILTVVCSIFVGLYAAVVVYQERSFKRGVTYVIAMVAEFDEYTNDWLYLPEGTIFPKPRYRKRAPSQPSDQLSVRGRQAHGIKISSGPMEAPAMHIPRLANSRSVRESIHQVKMVQIWGNMMRTCEMRGKQLLDAEVITPNDLYEWLKSEDSNEGSIISLGLPCYSFLSTLLCSIGSNSAGLLLLDNIEVTSLNRPNDKLVDWFFNPILLVKEQLKVIKLEEGEVRFLEKVLLFRSNTQRMTGWDNGSLLPQDALRAAQIQGISRRMIGITRGVSKFPTYRRRFQQVVKNLIAYSIPEANVTPGSIESTSIEDV